jgi:hypothetical protein
MTNRAGEVPASEAGANGAMLRACFDANITAIEEVQRFLGICIDMQNQFSKWCFLAQGRLFPLAMQTNEQSLRAVQDVLGQCVAGLTMLSPSTRDEASPPRSAAVPPWSGGISRGHTSGCATRPAVGCVSSLCGPSHRERVWRLSVTTRLGHVPSCWLS